MDTNGEAVVSVSPALNIAAELVADPSEATKGMSFNSKTIELLFGNIPTGKTNILSQKPTATQLAPKPEDGK